MQLTSYEPFWLLKNGLLQSYPSLQENIQTDILIIGGGITGSLIAHQCMELGLQTIVIDKREIANGSTSASTCMLQYEIDVPLYQLIEKIGEKAAVASYRACSESIDRLGEIVKTIRSNCGFKKKQSLYIANSEKDKKWLQKEYEARQKNGFRVSWLSAEDIQDKYGIEKAFGGILSEQAASFDSFHFAHDLLQYNVQKGLQVYDKTPIDSIKEKDGRMVIETSNQQLIEVKKIIYCTGFETTEIIDEKIVSLLNTYAIASEQNHRISHHLNDTLFWDTGEPYHYWRTTDDGRILIGGEDEKYTTPKKKMSLIDKKSQKLTEHIRERIPDFSFIPDFSWCGTFGSTKDGLPYIGAHKKFPNSYFVLGFGGNGITFSVTGMEMVSCWLRNQSHPLQEHFGFGR